jgi:hypothetical protein
MLALASLVAFERLLRYRMKAFPFERRCSFLRI